MPVYTSVILLVIYETNRWRVVNVWGSECLRWWTSDFTLGMVNVWGGECLGGERLKITFWLIFTIWLITCYWNTCLWLQVLMYLFFHPVAAFNIFSKWKLSKSQMLRILLSAHCFAKSEPSPKTLFYFSADHCSLVLSKLCCKINTFPNSILCLTFSNISSCQS